MDVVFVAMWAKQTSSELESKESRTNQESQEKETESQTNHP
jgi:hypothetical protein